MRRLNLGCGTEKKEGFIGVDKLDFGQEIIRDITRGLPFDDNSVDEIYTYHCLEHIDKKNVPFVWEEIYRVLKPEGIVFIKVLHSSCEETFMMNHWSYWNEKVVEVLCNKWGSPDHHTKTNFEILENKKVGIELQIKLRKLN